MALDRYDDGVDGPDEAKHLRGGPRDADAAADRTELAEPRTRQEYFEALRAADGKPVERSDNQRASPEARTDPPAGVAIGMASATPARPSFPPSGMTRRSWTPSRT